jgi:glutathione reductase (NADPH)
MARLKEKRDAYIARLNDIYAKNLSNDNVTVINGYAKFTGVKTVECDGVTYTGDHVCIAVGGKPLIIDIPGKEHIITSTLAYLLYHRFNSRYLYTLVLIEGDGFFDLTHIPAKTAVIGAGCVY